MGLVDVFTMSDLDYVDNESLVFDGVQDSVATLANAITLRD